MVGGLVVGVLVGWWKCVSGVVVRGQPVVGGFIIRLNEEKV